MSIKKLELGAIGVMELIGEVGELNKLARLLLTTVGWAIVGTGAGGPPLRSSPPRRSSRSWLDDGTDATDGVVALLVLVSPPSKLSRPPSSPSSEFLMKNQFNTGSF